MTENQQATPLNMIVAVTRGGAIGRGGDMLFHIADDLRRFKALTTGHPVIMGRKTYQSLPRRPLPGRRNLVITTNPQAFPEPAAEGLELYSSPQAALQACAGSDATPFVIGGAQIYALMLPFATDLYITEIDTNAPADADTFFPTLDAAQWQSAEPPTPWHTDPRSGHPFRYTHLRRK